MASFSRPVSIKIDMDMKKFVEELEAFGDKAIEHFYQGVQQMGEATMTLSKAAYVPVVTGTLRSSGFVTKLLPYADGKMVDVGYGGAAAHYAAAVHFAPHSHGQHKNLYLSKPFLLMARQADGFMANWMEQLWRNGQTPHPVPLYPPSPPAGRAPKVRKARAPKLKGTP